MNKFSLAFAIGLTAASAAQSSGPSTLKISADDSQVVINVGKAGVFGFAGHAHEVLAPDVAGSVTVDPTDLTRSNVVLEFRAGELRVTGKDEPPEDVPEVQRIMVSERVLDARRFPSITFRSRRIAVIASRGGSADLQVDGVITIRGVTRPLSVRVATTMSSDGSLTARGAFPLKQSDFGIEPVTAGGGTVKVRDSLDVRFVVRARRS